MSRRSLGNRFGGLRGPAFSAISAFDRDLTRSARCPLGAELVSALPVGSRLNETQH